MRRLDRYVLRELLGPLTLGFVIYTFILLLQFLFKIAGWIIRLGVPVGTVAATLAATLPNILVLTIPMSVLFAVLVAVGRLASDSELIAMRACGISMFRLYRPIVGLSLLLTVVTLALMIWALPAGNRAVQELYLRIALQGGTQGAVQARVFNEELEGKILYVFETPPNEKVWQGILLADTIPDSVNETTVADRGFVSADSNRRMILHLENAVSHKVDLAAPDKYEVSRNRSVDQVLETRTGANDKQAKSTPSKSMRARSLAELAAVLADSQTSPENKNLARVERHKRFAIPFACLVFAICGLPLAFNNRRGGKSTGFAFSIGVILVYYILLTNGEEAARIGQLPAWLAMWGPNLLLATAGVLLAFRRNSDQSSLLRGLAGRLGRSRRKQPAPPAAPKQRQRGPGLLLRLPRLRLRFPNLLDRYILRLFLWSFSLVAMSCISIYVVADLSENLDEVIKNKAGLGVLYQYYQFFSLQIFYDLAPIIALITTLVVFSLLSRSNEVTATKSLGVSLYRLSLPALAGALFVSLACAFLQSTVLPASNQRVAQLRDQIKGRSTPRTYRRANRQWLFGQGRYIYNYLHYDAERQVLQRLQVFEFDADYRLVRRMYAASAHYLQGGWVFSDSWTRTFQGTDVVSYQRFAQPIRVNYPESPSYFQSDSKRPEQMTYGELRSYVAEVKASGQAVPDLEVELHSKIAFPVVSFVMALVALPFAFRLGKRGALYGLGIAIVLGMVFMGVFAFFQTMGETSSLPPLVAVWSPSLLFALLSGYLFLGVRT
jgi:LPS export ABC transporter permease LptG/LPS export ABC transporter permease LptF